MPAARQPQENISQVVRKEIEKYKNFISWEPEEAAMTVQV